MQSDVIVIPSRHGLPHSCVVYIVAISLAACRFAIDFHPRRHGSKTTSSSLTKTLFIHQRNNNNNNNMNNSHYYNTTQAEQEDYCELPIANLDTIQPLGAPITDDIKVSPLDVAFGTSDDNATGHQLTRRTKRQHDNDPLATPSSSSSSEHRQQQQQQKSPCLRILAVLTAPFAMRHGLGPWLASSVCKLVFNYRAVSQVMYRVAPPLFGIDDDTLEQTAWDKLWNATKLLGKTEEQCIQFGAAKCKEQFRVGRDVELEMIRQVHEANDDLLHGASAEWKQCMASLNATELALQEINIAGGIIPFVEVNDQCTLLDLQELNAIVGGEARQEREGIEGYVQYIVDERNAQYLFLHEWGVYNYEYFFGALPQLEADLLLEINALVSVALNGIKLVQVKGLNGFNGIIACVSPNGEPHQCKLPNANLNVSLEQLMRTAKGYIEYGEDQMQMAAMVIATLVDRYDWSVEQIELFVRVFSGIRDVLGRPFDLALKSFGSDIDLDKYAHLLPGKLYVSPDLQLIDKFPELGDYEPLLQDLVREVAKLKQGVSSVASQVSDEVAAKVMELADHIKAHVDKLLQDYHPPKHLGFQSIEEGANVFFMDGKNLKDGVAKRLKNLGKNRVPIESADEFVPPTAKIALDETSAQVNNAHAALFSFSLPDLKWLWNLLSFIPNHAWIGDILVRIWQIVRGFRKVWDKTAVPIPVINLPTTAEQEEEEENRGKLWSILTIMTSDWIPTIAKYTGIITFVTVVGLVYGLFYMDYRNGCVHSRNGTWIGRVAVTTYISNPILYDVNTAQTSEVASVQGFHKAKCENARILTVLNQTQQSDWLATLENDYNKTMAAASQVVNCIDFDDIDDFESDLATCALPLNVELQEKVATCDWGECVIDCGQDTLPERIQEIVVENTCVLEGQYHAKFWLFLLILYMYYSLQELASVIQECPPHLFPETFGSKTVKIQLERYIETGELLGSEGEKAEKVIEDAIRRQLRINKIKNWGRVLKMLLLNAAWIAFLCNSRRIINP